MYFPVADPQPPLYWLSFVAIALSTKVVFLDLSRGGNQNSQKCCHQVIVYGNPGGREKFPNLVRSSSIVFIEILLIFDNLSYFGVFLKKKTLEILGKFFVFKQTSDE